ncbi:hypothetical protein [Streptomyces sp. STCH 565 A]|uniref:hypothetical protein n=1 Tax=Streptomyces sp. STCH 565 A TaxID=2950532 RepID=UPI002075F2B9|nr:hypothetical protein [Streptomyces sp. STCH 565 A]MCM8555339.1 hypothetical protein [Streptomyces sp. STCH 565 A]
MADDVTITVHVRDLTGPGFNSVNRNINQLQRQANSMGASLRIVGGSLDDVAGSAASAGQALGKSGGGLGGVVTGLGAAVGTSLLPTLGALAPMLSGLGVVGGGAALAMDDLKKKAKELKPAFEDWKKAAEKAVAPHTERAVKSLKSAMKDLQPSLVLGAETFGTITERASKFAASDAFQGAFQRNAQMGVVFVEQLAESVGKFTQAFLEFGTQSQPALDAWQELLGGLLDTGLPGMFDGLEQGIGGASEMLSGFADFLNNGLLPALGKIAGSFAEAFGPLIGELFSTTGDALMGFADIFEGAMTGLEPVARIAADALRATNDVMMIGSEVAGTFAKAVGGALFGALLSVMGIDTSKIGDMTGGFTKLSDWVDQNEGRIRAAFYSVAEGITTMVTTGVSMLPELWSAFRMTTELVLIAVDGMVSGLATAFGDIPVVGDQFKEMNENFDTFAEGVRTGLDKAGSGINSFVDEALPRLNRSKLTMNVSEAEQNLASIKEKLEDPALTKERRAQLNADKKKAEAALAEAKSQLKSFDKQSATGVLKGDMSPFMGALGSVRASRIPTKTGTIRANTSPFWAVAGGLRGRVIGSAYVNVYNRYVDNKMASSFRAFGGPVRGYADGGNIQHFPNGGYVEGPGGPRSDSILATFGSGATAQVSDTEYVVQSSAVKKYGLPLLDALNRGTLKLAGGGTTKKERDARNQTRHLLSVSRYGQMAGWKDSEIRNALGDPGDISSLVTALSDWRANIQKATHGKTESNLLKQLDATAKKLFAYQKNLDKANTSLQKSKDRLDDLRQAASQLRESVMNGVLNSANITKNRQDGPVTMASIMAELTGSRDKSTAFADALETLRKKGVAGSLIEQIGQAGIDGGGLETAQALLKASFSEIVSLNKLQSQITRAAGAAGQSTSDAKYAADIKTQEALVKAWQTTVNSLKSSMDKLAAAMEKSVEKAWGKASGGIIGAASGGARGSWTMVGEHEPELVRLPFGSRVYSGPDTRRMQQQAWSSMLTAPRAGGQRSAGPAAGGPSDKPIVIHLSVGGREFEQIWVDTGRRAVSTRGGLQATLGDK